jgi:hypothetical protein
VLACPLSRYTDSVSPGVNGPPQRHWARHSPRRCGAAHHCSQAETSRLVAAPRRSTSIVRCSWVKSSTMFTARKGRPSASVSRMKSMDPRRSRAVSVGSTRRSPARRRLCCRRRPAVRLRDAADRPARDSRGGRSVSAACATADNPTAAVPRPSRNCASRSAAAVSAVRGYRHVAVLSRTRRHARRRLTPCSRCSRPTAARFAVGPPLFS